MCGIIGIFGTDAYPVLQNGLALMRHRGPDGAGYATTGHIQHADSAEQLSHVDTTAIIGHTLHSIVGSVAQPLRGRGLLVTNCEIYNWQQLCQKHGITAENDAQLLLALIESEGFEQAIALLDGVFAIAYWDEDTILLARDILGVKPLFYTTEPFSFASERKVLTTLGYTDVHELNPRQIKRYNLSSKTFQTTQRPFFPTQPQEDSPKLRDELGGLLIHAVSKRVPEQGCAVLFSGGVDSTLIVCLLQQLGVPVTCYSAALEEPGLSGSRDLEAARAMAEELGVALRVRTVDLAEVESYLGPVISTTESTQVVKVGVALPFYLACELAQRDGYKVIFSGLGAEEIFAGYERHTRALDINEECRYGLMKMYERDLYRDDVTTMRHSLELRLPFLDHALVKRALRIPPQYKLGQFSKQILREVAENLGAPSAAAWRKKRAAQYGSNFDKAIQKLARRNRCSKAAYLNQSGSRPQRRLGVLFSGGKDSTYAAWIMQQQNDELACLISICSSNTESYMYHTPNIWLTRLQARAMELPLLMRETAEEKEKELGILRSALREAQHEYGIEGIVTGALYSTYQRNRIEQICEELGLLVFSPLWHIDQEEEMRDILRAGFTVYISSVAAEGLDQSWLGRAITHSDIDRLVQLNRSLGLNVAGEGGEFESLILDGPIFKQKLILDDCYCHMDGQHCGHFIVKSAHLEP